MLGFGCARMLLRILRGDELAGDRATVYCYFVCHLDLSFCPLRGWGWIGERLSSPAASDTRGREGLACHIPLGRQGYPERRYRAFWLDMKGQLGEYGEG